MVVGEMVGDVQTSEGDERDVGYEGYEGDVEVIVDVGDEGDKSYPSCAGGPCPAV